MIPIMAAVAGVVDYVGTSTAASKVQNSLDATAFAIASRYDASMSSADVRNYGVAFFDGNVKSVGIAFNADNPSMTSSASNVVSQFDANAKASTGGFTITASAKVSHKGFVGGSSGWQAERRSSVMLLSGEQACLLALDPHASSAVRMQGSTQVKLNGCVVASNSDATDSVSRAGAAEFSAKCVSTVGGVSGLTSRTSLTCPKSLEKQYSTADPLSGVKPPPYGACQTFPNGKTVTLSPATFCNQTWSGKVTLTEGNYVLKGGKIKLGGNGTLTGSKVTIFLMEDAELVINGNEVVNLSPPTGGDYAGITIYQQKGNTNQVKINGTSGSKLSGFIYAPSANVFFAGNSDMSGSGDCVRIIGNTVEMTGNSAISSNSSAALGGREMTAGRRIALVK